MKKQYGYYVDENLFNKTKQIAKMKKIPHYNLIEEYLEDFLINYKPKEEDLENGKSIFVNISHKELLGNFMDTVIKNSKTFDKKKEILEVVLKEIIKKN